MVGRPRLWPDKMAAAFPAETFSRAAKILRPGEDRTDLVREAVERELRRRERLASSPVQKPVVGKRKMQ